MYEALVYLATSFWIGAVHAATPGHGKTIAAAYIVGARGRPVDAVVLGIFVTLSHTSGIVLVGVLASLGLPGMVPQRIEVWMAVITGLLVIVIGLWTLWTQREIVLALQMPHPERNAGALQYRPVGPVHAAAHGYAHSHGVGAAAQLHSHADDEHASHSHGWGFKHTHDMKLVTTNRPSLWILLWLGVAGGLLPDPAALAILLNALAQGKVMLGLGTVVVFSVGFASTLVLVGLVAAKVGQKILDWLAGPWAMRLQVGTSLLIVLVGVILTVKSWATLSSLS
jgi:nickel/cobalt exporter